MSGFAILLKRTLQKFLSAVKILKSADDFKDLGGYSDGVPPLPIPNREVKPASADGTAIVGE